MAPNPRTLCGLLAAVAGFVSSAAAQQPGEQGQTAHVVVGGNRRIGGSQSQAIAERLEQDLGALCERLGVDLPADTPPCRVRFCSDEADARAAMRELLGRELVAAGGLDRQEGRIVVWSAAEGAERAARVAAVVWWVERLLAPVDLDAVGAAWLAYGLAHLRLAGTGEACDAFLVRDALFPSVRCHGGDFAAAAATMARSGQLPALAALLQTAGSDFDFDQHAAAMALVDWLARSGGFAQTGQAEVRGASALQHVIAQLRVGKSASDALSAVFREPIPAIDTRWREALLAGGKEPERGRPDSDTPARPTHPRAALYVYVREPVLPRHRRVVAAALAARAASLTSAFRTVDNAPMVALGPVERGANFWKRGRLGKPTDHAWPFVVVLEYELAGGPQAFVDCFRRATGSRHDGGWMLDPNVDFVAHHNAQLATDQDERFGYVAIPDTPTGTHVGGSEFVHRGRVQWADGRVARLGVWTQLEFLHQRPEAEWAARHRWLVDWRVTERSAVGGATGCGPLVRPVRELAIWGTSRVLDLPEVPVGVRAGTGR